MKNRARFLSMLLALVMVLSLFASAAAEERPTLKVALTTSSMVTDYADHVCCEFGYTWR